MEGDNIKSLKFGVCLFIIILFLMGGCHEQKNDNKKILNWSVSKYSKITEINYEETSDGYKGAFYNIEDISIDKIKSWIEICEQDGEYYHYIYSDPDSWDMFIYYPFENGANVSYNNFKFYIDDSIVKIYVDNYKASNKNEQCDYILIRIQAPSRGVCPNSSELFINDQQIEFKKANLDT